jgi:hypothetical protein
VYRHHLQAALGIPAVLALLLTAAFWSDPGPAAAGLGTVDVGDANCDGSVNSIDASLILRFHAGLAGAPSCEKAADANGDETLNSLDAALILQYDGGRIDRLGAPPLDIEGSIAYIGDDGNVWITSSDGNDRQRLTEDAQSEGDFRVYYQALSWSPIGSRLAFSRHTVSPGEDPGTRAMSSLVLYEPATKSHRIVEAPLGRDLGPYTWKSDEELLVVENPGDFHGCIRDTHHDIKVMERDVTGGSTRELFTAPPGFFIYSVAYLPALDVVAYATNDYCEGPGYVCAFSLATSDGSCPDDQRRALLGRIDDSRLLVQYIPYNGEAGPYEVFDATTFAVREARDQERPRFASHAGDRMATLTQAGGEPSFHMLAGRNYAVSYHDSSVALTGVSGGVQLAHLEREQLTIDEQAWAPHDDAVIVQSGLDQLWIVPGDPALAPFRLAHGRDSAWQPAVTPSD